MKQNKDIIFIEKECLMNILKRIFIIISGLSIMFAIDNSLGIELVMVANIIIIFSMMLLSMVTFSFSENKFFTLSSICYVVIGILKVIELVEYGNFGGVGKHNFLDISKVMESVYVFISILYLRDFILEDKQEREINKKIDITICIVLILIFIINLTEFREYNKIYYRALIMIIFLKAIFYALKIPFKSNNMFNYFIITIAGLFCSSVINFFELFNNYQSGIIYLMECFTFFAYSVTHLSLNYKLLEKPSEALFIETYNRKEELIEINRRIDIKNKNLEKTQIELKNDEIMFKSIYRNIQIPLAIVSSSNNRILYANEKFENVVGVREFKEIINKNIINFIYRNNKNHSVEYIDFINKDIIEGIEIRNEKNHKKSFFNINILRSNKDNIILLFHDVTEEIKMEKYKKEFEKRVLEEKMKNDFLSNISHDIKTPINVIYSAIQLEKVLIKENKIEELKKYNHINKDNIVTITRLANNLIDSSKLSNNYLNANLEILNIVELVEDSCDRFVDYIQNKNLNFYFDTEEEEIYIKCDREFMERIIINIISNSIKYTKDGEITVNIYKKNNKAIIELKDTGIGIEKELLETVFEKYTMGKNRTKELNKNTGIGLYVVNSLVKLQKGDMKIKSKIGVGTTVLIEFFIEEDIEELRDVSI